MGGDMIIVFTKKCFVDNRLYAPGEIKEVADAKPYEGVATAVGKPAGEKKPEPEKKPLVKPKTTAKKGAKK